MKPEAWHTCVRQNVDLSESEVARKTSFSAGWIVCVLFVCVFFGGVIQAQTNASCSFKVLPPTSNPALRAHGVNDFGTIVGEADNAPPSNLQRGYIRYTDGEVAYYTAPNAAATRFVDRNNNGVSIGIYSNKDSDTIAKGFILNGSTFTSIVHPKAVLGTSVESINKNASVVGWYLNAHETPVGFKRTNNGSFITLTFPGASSTMVNGINDTEAAVGSYTDSNGKLHGFLTNAGHWATLDFPNTTGTELFGISNANVIVGIDHSTEQGRAFLYKNGKFEVISVPNSFATQATGISANGLIVGYVVMNGNGSSGYQQFTATCK